MPIDVTALVDSDAGLVGPRLFGDEDIYRAELDSVFGRSYLLVAHMSQLPEPGSFVTAKMGSDPVLIVRQADGSVRVFLNYCRHRGMKVCRSDLGTQNVFVCPYHGWTYSSAGDLIAVPNLEDGYRNRLEAAAWGLAEVPSVADLHGFVFASFDVDAPPLAEYLGEMAYYLEGIANRLDGGMEVVGVHRSLLPVNWKIVAEQFSGDSYHGNSTHGSFNSLAAELSMANADVDGAGLDALMQAEAHQTFSPLGHAFMFTRGMIRWATTNIWGGGEVTAYFDDAYRRIEQRLGASRAAAIFGEGIVFPNMAISASVVTSIRVLNPRSVSSTEQVELRLIDASTPEPIRQRLIQESQRIYGPSGLVEPDDISCWTAIGDNLGTGHQLRRLALNYQMGLGDTSAEETEYPGTVTRQFIGEAPIRNYYRRWAEMMAQHGDD